MKSLLIGSALSSQEIFKVLISNKRTKLCGIITLKEKNIGDRVSLEESARHNKIDCLALDNYDEKIVYKFVKKKNPDLIFCIGWNFVLSKRIFNSSKFLSIGFHPCPYPFGKGRHPIIWSIILDVDFIYNVFFKISEKIDRGHILSKEKILLKRNESSTSLYKKILKRIGPQTKKLINSIADNNFKLEKQQNFSHYWRKRTIKDGRINFLMNFKSIIKIHNALKYPYPGCSIFFNGNDYKIINIKKVRSKDKKYLEPGKIIKVIDKDVIVKTFDEVAKFTLEQKISGIKPGDYF